MIALARAVAWALALGQLYWVVYAQPRLPCSPEDAILLADSVIEVEYELVTSVLFRLLAAPARYQTS